MTRMPMLRRAESSGRTDQHPARALADANADEKKV